MINWTDNVALSSIDGIWIPFSPPSYHLVSTCHPPTFTNILLAKIKCNSFFKKKLVIFYVSVKNYQPFLFSISNACAYAVFIGVFTPIYSRKTFSDCFPYINKKFTLPSPFAHFGTRRHLPYSLRSRLCSARSMPPPGRLPQPLKPGYACRVSAADPFSSFQ